MGARTNKGGIAKKKAQLEKQAARTKGQVRFSYPKRKVSLEEGQERGVIGVQTNPKGHKFHRYLKGRKICYETKMRCDPDGRRFIKKPSGGSDFVQVHLSGWGRRKIMKNMGKK